MKRFAALVISVVINAAAFGALGWSGLHEQAAPVGEVSVTQLPADADLAKYAKTAEAAPAQAVL